MPHALLIGNGLNRCYDALHSWGSLLGDLAERLGVPGKQDSSFSMEFERIVNAALKADRISNAQAFRQIKGYIAAPMMDVGISPQLLHRRVMELPVDELLTTNYDYLLEYAADPCFFQRGVKSGSTEIRYSLSRKQYAGGRTIRHIHGEAKAPSSICLGFEHYAGALMKLRSLLLAHESGAQDVVLFNILRGCKASTGCFAELFFTHDLSILGYGLDRTEIDVWWLLTYRAFLMNANYRGMAQLVQNRVVFYHVGRAGDPFLQLRSLLESLNVEVVQLEPPSGIYEDGYLEALRQIEGRIQKI